MRHTFISYSHDDKKFMRRLRNSLTNAGFDIWADEKLQPGTSSWLMAIQQQIDESDLLVTILSPHAKMSQWVGRELFYAALQEVPIVPILAFGTPKTAIPLLLSTSQYIDMRSQADWVSGINQVVKTLLATPPKQAKTKPNKEKLPEYISLAQDSISLLTSTIQRMILQTKLLGHKSGIQVPEFQRAKQRGDTNSIINILKVISEYVMEFSDATEKQLPVFKQVWIGLMENMSAVFSVQPIETDEEKDSYIYVRSSLENLRQAFETGSIPELQKFQITLSMIENQSPDLQRAGKLARPVIEDLETSIQVGSTYLHWLEEEINKVIAEYETRNK